MRERWKEDIPSPLLEEPVVAAMAEGDGGDDGRTVATTAVVLPVAGR